MSKIINVCKQFKSEFKQITAPSPKKLFIQTAFVIAVSIICAGIITALDNGASAVVEQLIR